MTELTLTSSHNRPLKPLIQAALMNEARLLEAGKRQTERRLVKYEAEYQMSTREFVRRFESNELDETLELIEWIGEYRMLKRLQEKIEILQGIQFAS